MTSSRMDDDRIIDQTPQTTRVIEAEQLAQIVAHTKESGKKVVSTNGVYDFLHAGHVEYLEQARALGDMLIVALNSDASVRRIKGEGRPINTQNDRACVLAGLRCVDYVTIFDEDDPCRILGVLKPSIHTKGGDYNPEKMPETKIIRLNGGEVKILPLKRGYSNSMQYERVKTSLEQAEKNDFKRPDWLTNAQLPKT